MWLVDDVLSSLAGDLHRVITSSLKTLQSEVRFTIVWQLQNTAEVHAALQHDALIASFPNGIFWTRCKVYASTS